MALRTKWENPTKELKEHEKHDFYTILSTCEQPLMDEIGKQQYQVYSQKGAKVDLCPIKLMKIISYLCDDNDNNNEEDDVKVISDSDTECDNA